MEKGLHIGQDGFSYKEIENIAIEAEKAGIHTFSLLDHLHASPEPSEQQFLECWTTLSALATKTNMMRLGAQVININNRSPALLAKMATTFDEISNGRLDFGIGAGGTNRAQRQKNLGYEYEFNAYGIEFSMKPSIRIERLDEGLKIIKKMWTQDDASFQGKHYSIKNAYCLPKPVQDPYPPIWIGSRGGSLMMKVIAEHADGWNIAGINTIEEFLQMKKKLAEFCNRIGREVDEIKTSMNIHLSKINMGKFDELESAGLDLAILRFPRGREIELLKKI